MRTTVLSTLILWLGMLPVMAQLSPIRQLGTAEGLSSDYVLATAIDKHGLLWVATEEGLNRFDGSRFLSYYHRDGAPGLAANELAALLDDPRQPRIWIATQRAGLNVYDYQHDSFGAYRHDKDRPASLCADDLTSLAPSADSSIWITTYWKGLDYHDRARDHFVHYNTTNVRGLVSDQMWCALDMGGGLVYVGHVRHGMSVIDTRSRTARNYRSTGGQGTIAGNEVHCIYRDRSGRVWVGTDGGLCLFDPTRGTFATYDDGGRFRHPVYSICQLADGRLWVGSEQGGVAIMQEQLPPMGLLPRFAFSYIGEGHSATALSGGSVRSVSQDGYGNVWVGIYGAGLNFVGHRDPLFARIAYSPYAHVQHPNTSLSAKGVLGMDVDPEGRLWVGTDGEGINVFDARLERHDTAPLLPRRSVQAVLCDRRGRVWMGCFNDNLYMRPAGGGAVRAVLPTSEDVRCLYAEGDTTLWAGTSNGLYEISLATARVKRHVATKHAFVRCMARDRQGRLWVGTFGGGILVYDRHFRLLRQLTTSERLPSSTINAVLCDRQGRVWLGTAAGLVSFGLGRKGYAFEVYTQRHGMVNTNIRMLAEDREGNLWFATSKGIGCRPVGSNAFTHYDQRDNVSTGSFTSGCMAMGHDGTLFFGGTQGITWFSPAKVLARQESPQAFITSLTIAPEHEGQPDSMLVLVGRKEVRLTHRQTTFSVHFNVLDYAVADGVEYAYRLKGLQDEWTTTHQGEITLRNMPYGHYVLDVRSRLHNQDWAGETATVAIVVSPPWWLSWWAWLVYTAVATLVIFNGLRFYRRKLRLEYLLKTETDKREQQGRLNEERLRFFTNITHELRTPLTLILGPLEDMAHSSDIPARQKRRLAIVYESATRLKELINQILEFRKTETDNRRLSVVRANIVDAVHEVSLKYEELSRSDNVAIRFMAPEPVIHTYFDPEVIRVVVDNLVSNALKYTERGTIDIKVERRHEAQPLVEISVTDTGHGISPQALGRIFDRYYQEKGPHQASGTGIGLAVVKSLVTLHEGTVRVESTVGRGSRFVVALAEHNVYPQAQHGAIATPHTPLHDPASPTLTAESEAAQRPENTRDIMLVVEDNPDIRQYIADSFAHSFDVRQADDGKQGLAMALECIPDIIVSDIMMPGMDGNTLCKTLKADLRTSHIPIILLTAKDSNQSKEEGYDAGADSYITKPFSSSLLESRVKNLMLSRHRLVQRLRAKDGDSHAMRQKQQELQAAIGSMDRDFLDRINRLLDDNISGELDVNYLASHLNISASTLYRKMKGLTGMNTNEYIRHHKMTHAEKLLLQDKYTISEIAFMVGINSIAYFRKCFKEEFGSLPSEYLRKIKDNGQQ